MEKAIADLIQDYQEFNPNKVDELMDDPSPLEFMRYVARNRPFVIRGGAASWKACLKWDADYLTAIMKDSPVKVAVTPMGYV
jgi:jumonji domain-containing protein 7